MPHAHAHCRLPVGVTGIWDRDKGGMGVRTGTGTGTGTRIGTGGAVCGVQCAVRRVRRTAVDIICTERFLALYATRAFWLRASKG